MHPRILFGKKFAQFKCASFLSQIKYDTTPGLVSRMGLIYIAVVMVAVSNANNVIPQVMINYFLTLALQ
jgi:hypothetical protein